MSEHNQHHYDPDTGQAECECCCGWALEYEKLQTAIRALTAERDGLAAINQSASAEVTELRGEIERLKGLLREWQKMYEYSVAEVDLCKRTDKELGA